MFKFSFNCIVWLGILLFNGEGQEVELLLINYYIAGLQPKGSECSDRVRAASLKET